MLATSAVLAIPIESSARIVRRRSNTITLLGDKRNIMLFLSDPRARLLPPATSCGTPTAGRRPGYLAATIHDVTASAPIRPLTELLRRGRRRARLLPACPSVREWTGLFEGSRAPLGWPVLPPLDRSNTVILRHSSSRRMQRLSVDCRSTKASAARRKLPWSAAATAYRRCCRSTADVWMRAFLDLESCMLHHSSYTSGLRSKSGVATPR
jgi:hypothetical protein